MVIKNFKATYLTEKLKMFYLELLVTSQLINNDSYFSHFAYNLQ